MDQLRMPDGVTILTLGPPDVADRANTLAVGLDETGAAFAATDHLLALGHETVWHIAGPANWTSSQRRTTGWRAALQDAGVAAHAPVEGDWSPQSGTTPCARCSRVPTSRPCSSPTTRWRSVRCPPSSTPVCPSRGTSASSASTTCRSPRSCPPLTTIRQDFDEATRLAMHRLFRPRGPPARRAAPDAPGQLVTRATSAPPSDERRHLRPAD